MLDGGLVLDLILECTHSLVSALILVMLDGGLVQDLQNMLSDAQDSSLNPCYVGRWTSTQN